MLVYQLMSAEHALQNLKYRRLKVSLLDDLNDPFELLGAEERSQVVRAQMAGWRAYMTRIARLLCFSKRFTNPVLWSHYADKHKGIALGFDVPDSSLLHVDYATARLRIDFEREATQPGGVSKEYVHALLRTKFEDWRYENEVRMFVQAAEVTQERSLQFYSFGPELRLRRVLIGPKCKVSEIEVKEQLSHEDHEAKVYRTRLAFGSYKVIRTPTPRASADA